MFNQMADPGRSAALQLLVESDGFVVSDIYDNANQDSLYSDLAVPVLAVYYPVSRDIVNDQKSLVGAVTLLVGLESVFEGVLQGFEADPVTAVVETSCGKILSFLIEADQVTFLGSGDLHEIIPDVGAMELISSTYQDFEDLIQSFGDIYPTAHVLCSYRVKIYPTNSFYSNFLTNRPLIIEALVGLIFLFTVAVFLGYDCLVERRQRSVLAAAQRTNVLVGSIFPQEVRDRLVSHICSNSSHSS
jgi:hypothetical protein